MRGTFGAGIDHLIDAVGTGPLNGHIEVDQRYAHDQHEGYDYHHPDGGQAGYLTIPFFGRNTKHMQQLADGAITREGSDLEDTMADIMEDMSGQVYELAPWEFADLRASGHPFVESDGHIIYDRPPNVHRLSADELKAKNELRQLFDPHRYSR